MMAFSRSPDGNIMRIKRPLFYYMTLIWRTETAIEIIDMDGRDENGMPIVEQVAEYYGKKL